MSAEKAPALFLSSPPLQHDTPKEKFCTKSVINWLTAAVLISLLIVLAIEFFYSPCAQKIRIYEENPIEVRMIPPRFENSFSDGIYPVNSWDFEFLLDPVNLCATVNPPDSQEYERNPEVKFLMLVSSAVNHFQQRTAIRDTWGSLAKKLHGPMRLGFVLGTTSNKTVSDRIRQESLEFHDIIQANFNDSYQKLTTKSVLMLKWVAERCPHAQYFMKADDDTFVNMGTVANMVGKEPYVSQDRFIGGYVENEAQPMQPPDTIEEISTAMEDYPPTDIPPYVSGSAYFMTIPTALELFDAAKVVEPILPEADAFLTGLCARHIDAPLIHESSFVIKDPPTPPSWKTFSTLATAHSVTPETLETVWKEMTQSVSNSMFYLESAINSTVLLRRNRNL